MMLGELRDPSKSQLTAHEVRYTGLVSLSAGIESNILEFKHRFFCNGAGSKRLNAAFCGIFAKHDFHCFSSLHIASIVWRRR